MACRSFVRPIHVLHVTLSQTLHHQRSALRPSRREKQVHVICHQHIAMHRTLEFARKQLEVVQVEPVIVFREAAGAAVVAALNEVPWKAGKPQTCTARHSATG
jgi:hypothetical protein